MEEVLRNLKGGMGCTLNQVSPRQKSEWCKDPARYTCRAKLSLQPSAKIWGMLWEVAKGVPKSPIL